MKYKPLNLDNSLEMKYAGLAIDALIRNGARKATFYLSENYVVTAARPLKPSGRSKSFSLVLTFGKPNYRSRLFIKACQKAGEPFPIKKVQLKFWTK